METKTTSQKTVRMFTTPTCIYCKSLKEFFGEHNVSFDEIDVSRDQAALREMVEKSGQMGVPVTEINGQIVVGFDQSKISELLNIK